MMIVPKSWGKWGRVAVLLPVEIWKSRLRTIFIFYNYIAHCNPPTHFFSKIKIFGVFILQKYFFCTMSNN